MGAALGSLSSTLRFDNEVEVDIQMQTVSLAASKQLNDKLSLRGGIGLIHDGTLNPENRLAQNVMPGGVIAVGLEYLQATGEGYTPSIDYSFFVSASSTKTEDPLTQKQTNYFSSDLRLGARASWNISYKYFPYLSARVFGGPVSWKMDNTEVMGSDIHHYQVALGTAVQFGSMGTFLELSPLGEQTASVGFSYAW